MHYVARFPRFARLPGGMDLLCRIIAARGNGQQSCECAREHGRSQFQDSLLPANSGTTLASTGREAQSVKARGCEPARQPGFRPELPRS